MCKYFLTGAIALFLLSCAYHDLSPESDSPDGPLPEEPFICAEHTVSWQADILPIMEKSCATPDCHDGKTRLDWRNYNEVKRYASSIKRRTVDRSMPFDKSLPQIEIDKIKCWVDQGSLNN